MNSQSPDLHMEQFYQLKPFSKKLYTIADETGRTGFHPLAPQIRFVWHLKPFQIPTKKEPAPVPTETTAEGEKQ